MQFPYAADVAHLRDSAWNDSIRPINLGVRLWIATIFSPFFSASLLERIGSPDVDEIFLIFLELVPLVPSVQSSESPMAAFGEI